MGKRAREDGTSEGRGLGFVSVYEVMDVDMWIARIGGGHGGEASGM
jgi:hypothetical protein